MLPDRRRALGLAAVLVAALVPSLAHASAQSGRNVDLTANWSGYAATGSSFSGVAGTWTVPTADCISKQSGRTAASFWVGLGGDLPRSKKIEQIGTDSDCDPDGSEVYFAWYELWPRHAVGLRLQVAAGDRVRASVTLHGNLVRLELENLETGKRFRHLFSFPHPDTTSAEWIGEAPALKVRRGTPFEPLTRFGRMRFSHATATSRGRTASIADGAWTVKPVGLDSLRATGHTTVDEFLGTLNRAKVVPSGLGRDGNSFSLTWTAPSAAAKRPTPAGAA